MTVTRTHRRTRLAWRALCLKGWMGSSPSAATSDQSLQLGRYRIIEEVSRTVGSVVYKARDPLIDRLVMLKTLAVGLPHDEQNAADAAIALPHFAHVEREVWPSIEGVAHIIRQHRSYLLRTS